MHLWMKVVHIKFRCLAHSLAEIIKPNRFSEGPRFSSHFCHVTVTCPYIILIRID